MQFKIGLGNDRLIVKLIVLIVKRLGQDGIIVFTIELLHYFDPRRCFSRSAVADIAFSDCLILVHYSVLAQVAAKDAPIAVQICLEIQQSLDVVEFLRELNLLLLVSVRYWLDYPWQTT